MGDIGKIVRLIQVAAVFLDVPEPSVLPKRTSGTIKMRDYEKEPLTDEELKMLGRDMKPSSRMFEMEKREWRYLIPASEYGIRLVCD